MGRDAIKKLREMQQLLELEQNEQLNQCWIMSGRYWPEILTNSLIEGLPYHENDNETYNLTLNSCISKDSTNKVLAEVKSNLNNFISHYIDCLQKRLLSDEQEMKMSDVTKNFDRSLATATHCSILQS